MKKIVLIIMAAVFLMSVSVNAQDKKTAKYLFKIATEAPAGSSWHTAMATIGKELSAKTNGDIQLQIYAGGIMGDQASVVKKMTIGQINGATFSNNGLQVIYNDFGVVGFPLMMRSSEDYDHMIANMGDFFKKKFKDLGYTLLSWTETGSIYIYSKKPIDSEAALRNSKPFILPGDVISKALFDELKTTPVPIQTSDILTSLKTGQIDTVFSPPYGLIAMQWHGSISYATDFPITFMLGTVMVDNKIFDSMPKNYQDMMSESFYRNFEKLKPKVRSDNQVSQDILKKYGVKFITITPDLEKRFVEVGKKSSEKLISEMGYSRELYNKLFTMMENFRKNKK